MHPDTVKTIIWLLQRPVGADLLEINDHLTRLPKGDEGRVSFNRKRLFDFCLREGLWLKIVRREDGCRYHALDLIAVSRLLNWTPQ